MMDEMNTKIICIRLGNVHVVAVTDPKIAREFLKDKDGIFSSRPNCMSGFLTSGGYLTTVLVPVSDHWKMMRKILHTEILSPHRHKWLQDKRDREADNLLRYVDRMCSLYWDQSHHFMHKEINYLTRHFLWTIILIR